MRKRLSDLILTTPGIAVVLVLSVALGLFFSPKRALADVAGWVPVSNEAMIVLLNGTPVRSGTLTSTGTSASVTVTAGQPLLVMCDATTHLGAQATCHATITNANYCPKMAADERVYIIPKGATLSAISASGTSNCSYFTMQ